MKIEISHIIAVGTIVVSLAGFYYTTQHRLDHLEGEIEELRMADEVLRAEHDRTKKQLKNKKNK
jgi:hypothetical protein